MEPFVPVEGICPGSTPMSNITVYLCASCGEKVSRATDNFGVPKEPLTNWIKVAKFVREARDPLSLDYCSRRCLVRAFEKEASSPPEVDHE